MADINNIAEELGKLTILEAAELVKLLEEKWGVSAAAPVAAVAAAGAAAPAEAAEEKTNFDVGLTEAGANVKKLVEGAPAMVLEGASKEDADKAKAELEKAGAKVTIK